MEKEELKKLKEIIAKQEKVGTLLLECLEANAVDREIAFGAISSLFLTCLSYEDRPQEEIEEMLDGMKILYKGMSKGSGA